MSLTLCPLYRGSSNPYQIRLEFRLNRSNCHYLNLLNFYGHYNEIIKRFIPYLTTLYNVYFKDYITTKGKSNTQFNRIKAKAENGRVRYTGKMRKAESVTECRKMVKQGTERNKIKEMVLGKFYEKMKSSDNG